MNKIIENKYNFMMLLECEMCNHNGDPDMNNLPRQDMETGRGILTRGAINRRIRNYIQDAFSGYDGMEIQMQSGTSINKTIAEAVLKVNETDDAKTVGGKAHKKVKDAAAEMCRRFWDVRAFGGVLSTGLNAGQVRGAVQIADTLSVDPIRIEDITITRMCYTEGDFDTLDKYEEEENSRAEDKKRTMGTKSIEYYGLYVVKGTINATVAEKNGFSERDLQAFLEGLYQCYDYDNSSSKEGMRRVGPIIVFKHVGRDENNPDNNARGAKLGCAGAHKLFNLLSIKLKDGIESPTSINDYDIQLNMNAPRGIEIGLKNDEFDDPIYGEQLKTVECDVINLNF